MATIFKVDGKTIRPGKAWVAADGTQHPANWQIWTADEKAEHGITEIVQEAPPDRRLYTWSYNDDGSVNAVAKLLDDINAVDKNDAPVLDDKGNQVVIAGVKSNLIAEVKLQQGALLSQTDWAVIRNADTGATIPDDIAAWRLAIRAKATEMEEAIADAADTDAIAKLFVTYTSEDDGNVTKSGVLYDWPEIE